MNKRKLLSGFIFLSVLIGISSVAMFGMIEYTSTPEYCASCHEMEVFYDAWKEAGHGTGEKGVVKAGCVDCHLPHEGTTAYLIAKARSGMHDSWAHLTGKETYWIANLEQREEFTYHKSCRKCHRELIAEGIPLKAFQAHREYELGEIKMNCVTCHNDAGHGDIVGILQEELHEKK